MTLAADVDRLHSLVVEMKRRPAFRKKMTFMLSILERLLATFQSER